jgi:hypothetical protein
MLGCSPGRFPIHGLPPDTQLAVYQHFKDPLEARKLHESFTDARSGNDLLDEYDYPDRGHLMVDELREWEAAGFPGTWVDWWSRAYAMHVAEHKERLAWIKADTDLGFAEWRERKAKKRAK